MIARQPVQAWVQAVLPQEARHRDAVDAVFARPGAVTTGANLIVAADNTNGVSFVPQVFNHLRAAQLVSPLMVRRIEVADDQNSQVVTSRRW